MIEPRQRLEFSIENFSKNLEAPPRGVRALLGQYGFTATDREWLYRHPSGVQALCRNRYRVIFYGSDDVRLRGTATLPQIGDYLRWWKETGYFKRPPRGII